jgi:hypothetical protein
MSAPAGQTRVVDQAMQWTAGGQELVGARLDRPQIAEIERQERELVVAGRTGDLPDHRPGPVLGPAGHEHGGAAGGERLAGGAADAGVGAGDEERLGVKVAHQRSGSHPSR